MSPSPGSYLRLYTTMPVEKMATFMGLGQDVFRSYLMCFKHKMKNVVWSRGTSGLDGEFQSDSEVREAPELGEFGVWGERVGVKQVC